jgi:hypothetical protein
MRKLTTILMASVFAVSIAAPARAGDAERLLFGIGAAVVGEVIKNSGNRKSPAPQRSAPASKNSSSGSRQSASHPRAVASKPKPVPDENVRFVQQKLHDLGYTEVGGADGFWGANSARALGIFMADNGIQGEPKASPEIIAALAKAKTRQEIADAKESAVAEASMPAAKVEDGIVHFIPKPEQQATDADAEHIATEDAVQPEDFSEEALTPAPETKTAAETDIAVSAAAPVPEPEADVAATDVTEPEAPSAETAISDTPPSAAERTAEVEKPTAVEQKQDAVVEDKDDGGAREINGLSISGDL